MQNVNKAGVTIVRMLGRKGKNALLLCRCPKCGCEFEMWRSHFYRGSNACRCRYTVSERLYSIWTNIKTRCYNPKYRGKRYYQDKGITMCDEWSADFKVFETWALNNGYADGLTIDRIDGDKGYYPENCRWATVKEQNSNKSNNIFVRINGEFILAKDCCRRYGLNYKGIVSYYYRHERDTDALGKYIEKRLKQREND